MRDLYARFVLFLVRPALALHEERQRVGSEGLAAGFWKMETRISAKDLRTIAGVGLKQSEFPSLNRG